MIWSVPQPRRQIQDEEGWQTSFQDGSWCLCFKDGRVVVGNAEIPFGVRLPVGAAQAIRNAWEASK